MAFWKQAIFAVIAFMAPLTAAAGVTFSEDSRVARISNATLTVGIDKNWGGAIREISFQGQNMINTFDAGRLMAVSVYDGNLAYPDNPGDPAWPWNAAVSDKYNHANPPLRISFSDDTLYAKSRLVQWNPGPAGAALPTDATLETWLSFPPAEPAAVEIRYRVTHDGADFHGTRLQEFPYAYLSPTAHIVMNGIEPPLDIMATGAGLPLHEISAPGHWISAVRDNGLAFTLFAPAAGAFKFTRHAGSADFAAAYIIPEIEIGWPAQSVREQTVYAIIGPASAAAAAVARLAGAPAPVKPAPFLAAALGQSAVYEIINGLKHWLPTPAVVALYGQTEGPVVTVTADELNRYPRARLLKTANNDTIYYLTETGYIRPVPSLAALKSYGNTLEDVITIKPEELKAYPRNALIYSPDTKRVYLIQGNRRRWVSASVFKRRHYSWSQVAPVNAVELKAYKEGKQLN